MLARAPAAVRLVFDDSIRPASGIAAIRNGGGSILRGRAYTSGSKRVLVIPLRGELGAGDYTVRWRIVSDDGHLISGVFAFAVGSGRAPPRPALSAGGGGPPATDVLRRFLFFAGVLLAGGSLAFQLAVRRAEGIPAAALPAAGFALALIGSNADLSPSTRFERMDDVAAIASLVGIAAVAASFTRPRLLPLTAVPAAVLLVVPALRGHALDPGHSQALAATADVVHVAAAAVWVGGVAQLALVLPGLSRNARRAAVRRFSGWAVAAVALIGLTGIVRAWGELDSLEQVGRTGYGRAILVKTALVAGLLVFGWLNRARLTGPRVGAELLLLLGVIVAVSILTDLRPGRLAGVASGGVRHSSGPLRLPPEGSIVQAQEDGDLAVALAARPVSGGLDLIASVVGPDRLGVEGLGVRFAANGDLVRSAKCGGGCYRALVAGRPRSIRVRLPASAVVFRMPSTLHPAGSIVAHATGVYRRLRTLVLHERLASNPRNAISTTYRFAAPDRMSYRIRGGPAGIVIGRTRWDQVAPGKPWIRSGQDPLHEPTPFWTTVSNAYLLRRGPSTYVVSFLDRSIPAWFTTTIDRRTYRTLTLRMTASAHFMRHRYGPFNAPLSIRPPR